ncbi:hypothetical protein SAY87_030066 [Trapa incisa]|uniref:non-specific serine/threonine protein kinase n=1 Tax=Trapa incisa TaxID=236973 RepID=A0AAN7QA05_9MYRT|nr:hypothetical protein SAY87_030066 [Trapa incisa]
MVFKFHTPSFSDNGLEKYPMILRKFSLSELRAATQKFSRSNVVFLGKFCIVYRGLLQDGSLVAIKRPRNVNPQKIDAHFRLELRFGSNIMARHPNALTLIGFCHTEREHLLVYPLVTSRRNLESSLKEMMDEERPVLDWAARKKVALGVARGLVHLHSGCDPVMVVHGDVRSSNIWLDEESNPVLGYSGFENEEGEMAEEGKIQNQKMKDVVAYGIVLLKLVTGERTIRVDEAAEVDNSHIFLVDWIKRVLARHRDYFSTVVDGSLNGYYDEEEAQLLVNLGLLCTHGNAARRPEMLEVVKMLEGEIPTATTLQKISLSCDQPCLLDYSDNLQVLKRVSLDEIRVATRKFGPSNLLGEGRFSVVYRGKLADGSLVAVKRLIGHTAEDVERQFETEVMIGSNRMANHPNLLGLVGFCCEEGESLLVYPLMFNKSLEHHLRHDRDKERFPPLNWQTRKRIALGAARGLAHLHDQFVPSIVHRDICPSNILLDLGFEAVIGDFGWARLMTDGDTEEGTINWSFPTDDWPISSYLYKDTYINTSVRGTDGYIASEYISTGKCTLKSDVFAFGNLLLELMTGQPARLTVTKGRRRWTEPLSYEELKWQFEGEPSIMDEDLHGEFNQDEAMPLIDMALKCRDCNPCMRPKMREVVRMMEECL